MQFENLLSYPIVQQGIENETLRLVGMWFDIANAKVDVYDAQKQIFIPVDSEEVKDHKVHPRTEVAAGLGSAVACATWDGYFDTAMPISSSIDQGNGQP